MVRRWVGKYRRVEAVRTWMDWHFPVGSESELAEAGARGMSIAMPFRLRPSCGFHPVL